MNTEMFEQFYKATYDIVYKFVQAKAYFKFQLEDIVQDTYYIAFLKKDVVLNHENPQGWLIMIAKNVMMQYVEKEMNDRKVTVSNEECLEYTQIAHEDNKYGLVEAEDLLNKYLSREECRLFYEFYVEGYSGKELEAKYRVSGSCLRMRLKRIKEKVRCVFCQTT